MKGRYGSTWLNRNYFFTQPRRNISRAAKTFSSYLGGEGLSLGFSGAAEDALGIISLCTKTWLEIYCCIHNFAYYCVKDESFALQ